MENERPAPDFGDFARWIAARQRAAPEFREPTERLLAAARRARDDIATTRISHPPTRGSQSGPTIVEVLTLLAAASTDSGLPPPELMTPRGFRVTLSYEEESGAGRTSICVLVRCPQEMIDEVQGKTVYLRNGAARFELGQFDSDGKALGTLPAGIEITLSDFAKGLVKLEAPQTADDS
jgi:nicotinamidase-related amidase